jgi:hypothetical protein
MVTDNPTDTGPCFRKAGGAVLFTRHDSRGIGQLMMLPLAGGAPVALAGPHSHAPAVSPVDDAIAYVADRVPLIAGPRGGGARPLAPALAAADYNELRFSPDGARIAMVRSNQELIEIDVARRAILRTIPAEPSEALYTPFWGPRSNGSARRGNRRARGPRRPGVPAPLQGPRSLEKSIGSARELELDQERTGDQRDHCSHAPYGARKLLQPRR